MLAFEPDSLGTLTCLAKSRRRARLRTLNYGVKVLSRLPNATVYLEGGASDWKPVSYMAPGVDRPRAPNRRPVISGTGHW